MILRGGRIKLTFNSTTTALFHSILDKCCWKVLRRSLTFNSPSNNNGISRLCRSGSMFRNGNNCRDITKQQQQQRLTGNIVRRMNSNWESDNGSGEVTNVNVGNNKTQTMNAIKILHEFFEYTKRDCKDFPINLYNIDELWYFYVNQNHTFLNNIPIHIHLRLLTSLYEEKDIEKVLIIIKYLRGRENIVKWLNNNLMMLECIIKLNIKEAIKKFNWLNIMKEKIPIYTVNYLISKLVKSNEIITAEELFGKVGRDYEDVKIYNSMMNGYVKEKNITKALDLLELMQRNGIKPSLITYNILLNLFGNLKAQAQAEQVFEYMMESGIEPDITSYCGIMLSCANNKNIEKCFYYFKQLTERGIEPNIYIYSILMSACVKAGYTREAIRWFERMVHVSKIEPNVVTLTTLICAWIKNKPLILNNDTIDLIFEDIKRYGVPDLIAYTALINAKTKQLKLDEAIFVYQQMLKDDIKPNVYTYTILVDACAKLGDLHTSLKLFEDMKKSDIPPNQFTYCAIMVAFVNNGQLSNAFKTFEEMKQHGLQPDIACINCLMDACNRSGLMSLLFQLYSDLTEKYNLKPDNRTISIYIDACAYNDQFHIGKNFYMDLIKNQSPIITLNIQNFLSIINLLGKNGYSSEIVEVLKVMKQRLIKPDKTIKLAIFTYLYELDKRKEIEDVKCILHGWTSIPNKCDLIKFKNRHRW
ncbi:3763_t:CDS:1 [Funneliformis caledonium]|uniref:3763_t:CDS:1 n=1 Tax=Funneliformis caledonium TaxID=1117310 RepID=A0A9N9A7Q5_9GLOM|nr:3763_t:CDS:1 [Funneliformis caledonium]